MSITRKTATPSARQTPEEAYQPEQVEVYPGKKVPQPRRVLSASSLFLVLFLASSGSAFYFYNQAREIRQNPTKVAEKELREVVEKVGQLIVLPEGETPTLATVADPEKLRDQTFFAKAKVGDKVLIYTGARKAILYDPSAHKIVEVAALNIGQAP